MSMDLNELAVEAKHSDAMFREVLQRVEPLCRRIAYKYSTWSWMVDRDDVYQWALIEVWNAVKTFETEKMSFFSYCRMTVENHIRSRLRRLYGRANVPNRTAMRLDGPSPLDDKNQPDHSYLEGLMEKPSSSNTYHIILRKDVLHSIRNILQNGSLTSLEYNCLVLFYFEERSHIEIQQILELHSRKSVDNALTRVRRKLSKNEQLQEMFHVLCS